MSNICPACEEKKIKGKTRYVHVCGQYQKKTKRKEQMSNNTQLPAEVVAHAELKCHNITKEFKDVSHYDAGFNYGFEQGYERAAIEAAHLLYEVFTKHESGLLPDRFVYDKIKRFLYGE